MGKRGWGVADTIYITVPRRITVTTKGGLRSQQEKVNVNPFTVQFSGWKMHERACKQYIFRFFNPSAFNAICVLMTILSHTST